MKENQLGDLNQSNGYDELKQLFLQGGQHMFRTYIAARLDLQNESFVEEIMMELADQVRFTTTCS
jgi:hypothetical protein